MVKAVTMALIVLAAAAANAALAQATARLDLTQAVVVTAIQRNVVETNACRLLVEESAKRSGVKLKTATVAPSAGPVIYLGTRANPPAGMPAAPTAPAGNEGYVLRVAETGGRTVVTALGNEASGAVFAAGRLLRETWLTPGKIESPALDIATSPAVPLRGHQIGYRPTPNSYDLWDAATFEQYVRDMVIWGTNAVELIPTDSGMPFEKTVSMNDKWSAIIHAYGMQVWLWYPLDDQTPPGMTGNGLTPGETACPSRPDGRKYILDQRREVFKRLKFIDVLFVPGGDPGGCNCELCRPWVHTMIPLVEEIAGILRETHPRAQVWVSNQGYRDADNVWFYNYLHEKQPKWLNGLVYGPWAEETLQSMRDRAPAQYPIRQYPDITHAVRCQFPARDWDVAFAQTLGREAPMYRIHEEAHIAATYQKPSCGALTYSEGINDDIHKMIWSAVLWDPAADPVQIAREFARYYFGSEFEDDALTGLLGLESAWQGPVLTNASIPKTYDIWRGLEIRGGAKLAKNWRFQMALVSAIYDRYVQLRLGTETQTEKQVLADLAKDPDPVHAVGAALVEIDAVKLTPDQEEMKKRLLELGQAMYDSIGMQLSVTRWGAAGEERGAIMDYLDARITNLAWIKAELGKLVMLSDTRAVRAGIDRIVNWENPGPGGFYDDLGNPTKQPHLVRQHTWDEDPGYVKSTRCDFASTNPGGGGRMSWINYAETLYGVPIIMHYDGLDPNAQYLVRAVYSGRYKPTMTLTANDKYEVHGPVRTPATPTVMEWPVPKAATASGQVTLRWERTQGRGAQVSEVWLVRK